MRDYVRLVKDLRGCNRGGVCSECSYENLISECECISAMEKDAADAIEELLAELTTIPKQLPHWISVEERLPEEYKDVLCYCEYFRYGDYNCMFRAIDRGYYGNGRWGGEAGQGHKNKVLAWMPLPEPPKGVE